METQKNVNGGCKPLKLYRVKFDLKVLQGASLRFVVNKEFPLEDFGCGLNQMKV